MMSKDIQVIERYVGRLTTDIRSGWETGLLGQQRCGSVLIDRLPPEHLIGARRRDWLAGQEAAGRFLQTRRTHFQYKGADGEPIEFWRKGFANRSTVVSGLRKKGIFVDIDVSYCEDGDVVRKVSCGY